MRLSGKAAIVTGAAGGIGRTFACALAREGAGVIAADVADAEATADLIRSAGGQAEAVRCDVTLRADADGCVERALRSFGRVDVLVNNAAVYAGLRPTPFDAIAEDDWERVMAVNVKGMWLMSSAVVAPMRKQAGGRIVNVSSGAALNGMPYLLHYVTSKAGVLGLTRGMAREVGDAGITVNAITPGIVWTQATEGLVSSMGLDRAGFLPSVLPQMAIKRAQEAEDLVGALLFLASDDAAMVTGQIINVDGGVNFH